MAKIKTGIDKTSYQPIRRTLSKKLNMNRQNKQTTNQKKWHCKELKQE